jgi:hypothetical protein
MQKIQFANSNSQSINRDDYDEFVRKWWNENGKWHPSIHMPKEAARIFLKVTNVKAERLQDMENAPSGPDNPFCKEGVLYECDFIALWDRTIKKSDLDKYGWDANPWVWVYQFERIGEKTA